MAPGELDPRCAPSLLGERWNSHIINRSPAHETTSNLTNFSLNRNLKAYKILKVQFKPNNDDKSLRKQLLI
jgi:hypothetical protein